jgi:hypothetical protein
MFFILDPEHIAQVIEKSSVLFWLARTGNATFCFMARTSRGASSRMRTSVTCCAKLGVIFYDARRSIASDSVELTAWLKMRVAIHILCYDRLRAEMKSYIQDTGDQRTRATLVFLEHVLRRNVWPVRDGRESRLAGARRVPAPHGRVGMVCGMGEGRYGTRPAAGTGEEGRKSALPFLAEMGEPASDVCWMDGVHTRIHHVVPKAYHPVPTSVSFRVCGAWAEGVP